MKIIQNFYENLQLIHRDQRLGYTGLVSLRTKLKPKDTLIGQFIVPLGKKRQYQLFKRTLRLIKQNKVTLDEAYILSPSFECIKATNKIRKQFQKGGFEIINGMVKRKRIANIDREAKRLKLQNTKRERELEDNTVNKRIRLEEDLYYNMELFDLVDIEYILTFITYFNDDVKHHRVKGFLRNVLKLEVDNEVDRIGTRYCDKQLYDTHVEKTIIKTKPVPDGPTDLLHERMFGVALNYHYLQIEPNSSESKECVYDFLLNNYQPYLKTLTKEYLQELFDEEDSQAGVSTYQIINFCQRFNISIYSLDLELNLFHRYKPKKTSHKLPALVYVCSNKHLYPIIDESLRNKIFATERVKTGTSRGYVKKSNKQQFNNNPVEINPEFEEISAMNDTNIVYTNLTTLLPLVLYLYQQEYTIYKTESYNSIITKIEYKEGVVIYLNEDYLTTTDNCKKLSIPFKNQNQIKLGKELFDIHIQGDRVYSTFNSKVREVFFKYNKGPFVFANSIPNDNDELLAFDVCKCYSAALSVHNDSEWSIFNVFDEITGYQGKLRTGWFYVESDSFFPLKGNGWYSYKMLKYCESLGIPFKVLYEIIPSYTLPSNYFNEMVDRIYEKCPNNAKFIINSMIGNFFKKTKKSEKVRFTADISEAIRYYFSDDKAVYYSHPVEGKENLYEVSIQQSSDVFENLLPFYWQIIDNANIQVHKLAMAMGGEIVSVKTDAVLVKDGNKVQCGTSIGDYRIENIKLPLNVSIPFDNSYKYKLKIEDWHSDDSPSKLLTGRAGTGKSYKMKQDLKDINNYVVCASTNRAARLVNGQTIHSLLGLKDEGSWDKALVIKVANTYKYIIIDEIGLLNEHILEILFFMKTNSNIEFIFLGDPDQLRPIQDDKHTKQRNEKQHDVFNSLVMNELVNNNRVVLTENKRSSDEVWDLFNRIDQLKPSDFGNSFSKRHITFTNRKRIQINTIVMEQEKKAKKKKVLFIEKNEADLNSQDVELMIGSPILVIKSNKQYGLINGDTLRVSRINPLTLKNTVSKNKIEIDKNIFQKHCYINYATTCYRIQGETLNEPFNIWEFHRMSNRMKYTSISRTTAKDLINVIDEKDQPLADDIKDTNMTKLTRNTYNKERLDNPIERRRQESHTILMNIIKGNVSDQYSLLHTLKTKVELLDYLGITNGIPKNYSIDHIRERSTCVTDKDFATVNYFSNLRLLPKSDNQARNWLK